ncbi:MAG: TonB-dependent receptor [Sphingorhabdus sp.]
MTTSRKIFVCQLVASTCLFALATPSLAQSATEPDVIIVTANKKSENLQEVPIAITAIGERALDLQGITETKDLSGLAPNVSVNGAVTNATAAVITIRGIATPADESMGQDSPIGLYLDGVYLARSSAASFEVTDIERIEVLRGPQGTLFGRNTTGGAINFITKAPSDESSIKLRAGYGNFGLWQGRVTVNTGTISDIARMTFSYMHKQRNGTVDNLLEPKDSRDPGSYNTDSARWATEIDLTDNIKITNIFDYTHIDSITPANQLVAVGNGVFRPNVVIDGFTHAQVQPANVAGYLAAATALDAGCGKPVQRALLDPICLQDNDTNTDKLWGNLFRVEADFDTVLIRSSTSFRRWRNNIRSTDLDGLGRVEGPLLSAATTLNGFPVGVLELFQPPATAAFLASQSVPRTVTPFFENEAIRRQNQFSQELEIVSDIGGDFEWVLGAFYFKESGYESNPQGIGFVVDTNQAVFNTTNFGALAPLLQANNPEQFRISPVATTLGYTFSARSMALYGQLAYRPGGADGRFGVTLGLRYSWDKKTMERFQNGPTPYTDPVEIALNQQSANFSSPSGHLTLDYRATDNVNLYARVAKGYRSGGFNSRQPTSVADNIGLIPFNEENIWSYEVGAKTQFFNRLTLNAAAFYNVYKDQIAAVPIPIVGGGSFGTALVNAGKTIYTGVEIEGRFNVTDNLLLDGSFGYVHKNVKEFPGADITGVVRNIAEVITLTQSPDYTANAGVTYSAPLGDSANLTARVGWSYTSSQEQFANPLTAPFQQETKAGARSLWNAQLRVDDIMLGGFGNGLGVTLWGKNIFDKKYVSRGVDFGQLGFGSVIYGDPATYGVTVDMAF